MRDVSNLFDAIENAIDMIQMGFDVNPDSVAYQRIENEIRWLFSYNRDPIDDALDTLMKQDVKVSVALDLHDLLSEAEDLTQEERSKLHFAINLKVSLG